MAGEPPGDEDESRLDQAGAVDGRIAVLSREDQTSLIELSWHWEGAYTFQVTEGLWTAVPAADPAEVLTAD